MGSTTDIHKQNQELQIDLVEIDGKLQRVVDSLCQIKRTRELEESSL